MLDMQAACERLRRQAVSQLFTMGVFSASWNESWGAQFRERLEQCGGNGAALLALGDHLTDVFTSTRGEGRGGGGARGQSAVSGGGAAWEGLVAWYLNLCLVGSRAVAVKMRKDLVPNPFLEAIAVSYGNNRTNTESDIVVMVFPEDDEVDGPVVSDGQRFMSELESFAAQNFNKFSLGIVQCKTNWNDNAQIPMLWDMLYSADTFHNKKISIGTTEFRIRALKSFSYSFVTVPTSRGKYNPDSLCVLRVNNISGGNYWGQPTKAGVAMSLKEIFNRNFGTSTDDFLANANETCLKLDDELSYFKL